MCPQALNLLALLVVNSVPKGDTICPQALYLGYSICAKIAFAPQHVRPQRVRPKHVLGHMPSCPQALYLLALLVVTRVLCVFECCVCECLLALLVLVPRRGHML
jgi:hypothetical protein